MWKLIAGLVICLVGIGLIFSASVKDRMGEGADETRLQEFKDLENY